MASCRKPAHDVLLVALVLGAVIIVSVMVAAGRREQTPAAMPDRQAAESSGTRASARTGPEQGPGAGVELAAVGAQAARQPTRPAVSSLSADEIKASDLSLKEAMWYEPFKAAGPKGVICSLCPNFCVLRDGQRGTCKVRINLGGKLRTLVYGKPLAIHVDPIEKKPLFHVLPGTRAFSIATAGCNLGCIFCQNWQISQAFPEKSRHTNATPEQVVATARKYGCQSIAYTYTEPTIFYEYMLDTARLARKAGLKNLWITCGYINEEPLRELCKYLDAANVDLKGFTDEFYQKYCYGHLQPVLNTLKILKQERVWFEITNLVIPAVNDDVDTIRRMCQWIVKNLGPDVPVHFSRFHGDYKMRNTPGTPTRTLEQAAEIARKAGIHYVFVGNVRLPGREDTVCPKCGKVLVQRDAYVIRQNNIVNGKCRFCGNSIPGVWVGAEGRDPRPEEKKKTIE